MKSWSKIFILTVFCALSSCTGDKNSCNSMESAFDWEGMDTSISPGDDFYHYAVGTWMKEAKIPKGRPSWGTFNVIHQENIRKIQSLFSSDFVAKTHDEKLLGQFYDSYKNIGLQNEAKLEPIRSLLESITSIGSVEELIHTLGDLNKKGFSAFFTMGVGSHPYEGKKPILYIGEAHLNLPDYEIYLDKFDTETNNHEMKRNKYLSYVESMFVLLGYSKEEAKQKANNIYSLEKSFAKDFYTKEERRDVLRRTNLYDYDKLQVDIPFTYEPFFNRMEMIPTSINVMNPKSLASIIEKIRNENLETLKTYLEFTVANSLAPYLGENFYALYFDLYGKTLHGISAPKPIDERAVEASSRFLSDPLGKAYVSRFFSHEKKEQALEMVDLIKKAFVQKIGELNWLEEPTKQKALEKLQKMLVLVGYPDDEDWVDFSSLTLDENQPLASNMLRIFAFHAKEEIERLKKEINPKQWQMGAQEVNACNVLTENKIIFPAGILQSPFFSEDPAICFGAFGMIISHEIIHSFDDQGRHFDAQGKQANWWQEKDLSHFESHARVIKEQFDRYAITFQDGSKQFVRGQLCLGENIADLGGVIIAYSAFEEYLKKHTVSTVKGFSPEQRFFLGCAQLFKTKKTEPFEKQALNNDPHSPPLWRINGTLSQVPAFRKAFALPDDCPMAELENPSYMWTSDSQKTLR